MLKKAKNSWLCSSKSIWADGPYWTANCFNKVREFNRITQISKQESGLSDNSWKLTFPALCGECRGGGEILQTTVLIWSFLIFKTNY